MTKLKKTLNISNKWYKLSIFNKIKIKSKVIQTNALNI